MAVQRDYGDRVDRARARFKYTVDDKGLDWIVREIEARQGFAFAPARTVNFTTNGDAFGWSKGEDGRYHYTLFLEAGRIGNWPGRPLLDGLREIAGIHSGGFRLTPNQNLIIANVAARDRQLIDGLLEGFGLAELNAQSGIRLNAIACVALPTCGLAMAEAERYLPALLPKIEALVERHGLRDEPITLRISGCPNGCSRPYVAEIGLTGRAPGKYNLYLGGGFHGERLNKMDLENVGEAAILARLETLIDHYARGRLDGERFGDFAVRAGYVPAVTAGRDFNS
jgi:sulfite reductase (NADPH) hemoprotein beta-component